MLKLSKGGTAGLVLGLSIASILKSIESFYYLNKGFGTLGTRPRCILLDRRRCQWMNPKKDKLRNLLRNYKSLKSKRNISFDKSVQFPNEMSECHTETCFEPDA